MNEMRACKHFFVLGLICGLAIVYSSGDPKVEEIKKNIGGGECNDSEDCNNNGLCESKSEEKGVCSCVVGFTGPNCENEDQNSKNSLGSLVSTSEVKEKGTKSGKVRTRLHRISDALKRGSQYKLYGLTPESAAKAEQPVLIFNPANEEYIFVSDDVKNSEKQNFYVESNEKNFADTTLFLMKKVPNDANKYYIYNPKKKCYLYISHSKSGYMGIFYRRNNVLASPVEPKSSQDESKYVFEFELGNDAYRIKQGDLYLYISKDTKGVFFSKPILKADTKEELEDSGAQFFQLNLREDVTNIKIEVQGEKRYDAKDLDTVLSGQQTDTKVCNERDGNNLQHHYKQDHQKKSSVRYSKVTGFSISGETGSFAATVGKFGFTYSSQTTTENTEEFTETVGIEFNYDVGPGKCACLSVVRKIVKYKVPFKLEAKSRDNKVVEANGVIDVTETLQLEAHIKDVNVGTNCPYQV